MEHARHVLRIGALVVVIIAGFSIARTFAKPATYGDYGPYRAAAVGEIAARAPVHGGVEACAKCHADKAKERAEGSHKTVVCEICHSPLASHVKDGVKVAAMVTEKSWKLCARCHQQIAGRPAGFPQQNLEQHVDKLEGAVCMDCHNPHSPKMQ